MGIVPGAFDRISRSVYERVGQSVKASGIINDPNLYSDDPHYIPDLIRRLVTVSVETMKIVNSLVAIDEIDCSAEMPDWWKVE